MKKYKLKNGFTLLLSVLVTSIILSVGLGIFNIMTKELKLSGLGRESQIAFYAADAGIECFFFWEIKHPDLADTAFGYYDSGPPAVKCAGNSIVMPVKSNGPYNLTLNLGNNSCAKVNVAKNTSFSNKVITTVESRGYNTACDSTSPFKVERAIQLVSTKQEGGSVGALPGVPGNVKAQAISDSQINLSWNVASGATNYLIYRGTDANNLSEIGNTTATSYNNTGLTDNTTYYYQVAASNYYGYTAESGVVSTQTFDASQSCVADGGIWNSSQLICYFDGAFCPVGWSSYENYSTTKVSSCSSSVTDCNNTSCTTSSHNRLNIGTEYCLYVNEVVGCYSTQCYASITEIGCKKN